MSSKEKRHVRQSRVELEYSPRHTYSLDSTYSLDLPLVLDVSVATPLSGYESLSASFRHNMRQSAMDTSAQVSHCLQSLFWCWRLRRMDLVRTEHPYIAFTA